MIEMLVVGLAGAVIACSMCWVLCLIVVPQHRVGRSAGGSLSDEQQS